MTPQPIRRWVASGFLAGAVALSGCGSSADDAARATPTATPAKTATAVSAATLPAGLRGRWERTMRNRDWKPAGRGYPTGTWRFDVARNGDVDVYLPRTDTVDFSTQFATAGQQLTIERIPVCSGETGRYTWRASASELTLTVTDDHDCVPRAALFGGTWHRH